VKVRTAPAANRELRITIELDAAVVESALQEAAAQAAQTVAIPGFRKAKVPYRVIERYVGRPALLSQIHEKLANETIQTYLRESSLGEVENVVVANIQDDPVTYIFHLALEPYTELGNYSELRVEPRVLELSAAEREEEKAKWQERYAEAQGVAEAADWQDWVTLKVKSVVLDEAQNPTDEVILEEEDWRVALEKEGTLQPPGLEQEILGLAQGQAKTFDLTYPEDSTSVYAGKSVRFDLEVKAVERYVHPEWDAALLAKIMDDEGGERSLAEYEEVFWNRLDYEKAHRVFEEELEEAFAALEAVSILEYPQFSVDAQVDFLISQRMRGLEQFGVRNLETYLRYAQQTLEEFRKSLEPEATATLKQNLLIWEFIQKNEIEIPADQQERLERQSADQAVRMMDSGMDKREGVTLDGITSSLRQYSMSETLRHLGRNALLEMCTEGVHSLVKYGEDLPAMALTDRDPEAAAETARRAPVAEFDAPWNAA